MYLPSLPTIGSDLDASVGQVQATLTAFFAGFCVGMLFYGPLSDRLGRRPVLLTGITIYIATSAGCALAPQIEGLMALRFLHALGGAAASVLSRTVIRDLFEGREAARAQSLMMAVMALAPLVAPIVGAQVLNLAGWRAVFWVLVGFGCLSLAAVLFLLPETLPPNRRLRGGIGKAFLGYARVLSEPVSLGYVVCGTTAFGGMFAYITASPIVYQRHFGLSPDAFALLFALNILAILFANLLNRKLLTRMGTGPIMAVSAAVVCASGWMLVVAALTGWGDVAGVAVCLFCFVGMLPMLGANCLAELLARFPSNAGAAASTYSVTQFGLAAVASLAVQALSHDDGPMAMAIVMAAAGSVSLLARCLLPALERLTDPGSSASASP